MAREFNRVNLEQQFLFEVSMEDLGKPNPGTIDIENALHSLSSLRTLSLPQSKRILELASSSNIVSWVRASEAPLVLAAITPSLQEYRIYVEQQDDPKLKSDYIEISSGILAGVIAGDPNPNFYQQTIAPKLREGVYGEYGPTLAGVVRKLSETMDKQGRIWSDTDADYDNMVGMLGELLALKDEQLMASVKPTIPNKLLYVDQERKVQYSPEINEFLESARRETDPEKFIQLYFSGEYEDQDELRERMLEGEFGDPATIIDKVISTLMARREKLPEDERTEVDITIYGLWLDLLDRNPNDPRVAPVTTNVMELDQYWEDDDVVYTSIESIKRLGLVGREEEFVEKYSNRISETLGEKELSQDQRGRVARFLREFGVIERESGQDLHRNIITKALLASVL